ncbi:MAG: ABC-type uncharacterized transport system auxiliary subunit [Enterobacterales bacterium]|jgi:ABC-type uncharacterized transport system auxiliary subunit
MKENSVKTLWVVLALAVLGGCAIIDETSRHKIVDPNEITKENLPIDSRVRLELRDGSQKNISVARVTVNSILDSAGLIIPKSEIYAITVLSWGDFTSNSSEDTVVEVATETGVNVLEAFGCLIMVIFGGVDSECN